MTVEELFNSLSFDEVISALRSTHCNEPSIKSVAAYKQAFDAIRLTEFEGKGGEVTFDVTPREEWYELFSLPMLARNVEGDYWENTVGKTVVRPDDNPFTDAELAGAILWGMTFYGFSRHARWSPYEERYTAYGDRADTLRRRLYLPYLRDKDEKRDLKSANKMPYGVCFTLEVWDEIHYRQAHQNRSKRKRFYRLKKRIDQLKRLDLRQHLIDDLRHACAFDNPQLEKRIMSAGSILESWRDSHVADPSTRAGYLAELMTKYTQTLGELCQGADEVLFAAYTSVDAPMTEAEEQSIRSVIASSSDIDSSKITFIKGIDPEAKNDIALQIIAIYQTKASDDE